MMQWMRLILLVLVLSQGCAGQDTVLPTFARLLFSDVAVKRAQENFEVTIQSMPPSSHAAARALEAALFAGLDTVATRGLEYPKCANRTVCSDQYLTLMRTLIQLVLDARNSTDVLTRFAQPSQARTELLVSMKDLETNAFRSVVTIPDYFSLPTVAILGTFLGALFMLITAALVLASCFSSTQLSYNARQYLLIAGVLFLGATMRFGISIGDLFKKTSFERELALAIVSDMVFLTITTILYYLLYLWADVYHSLFNVEPRRLPKVFLICMPLVLIISIAVVLVQRLLGQLPSSPYIGEVPYFYPIVSGLSTVAAIGLLVYSTLLFRRLRSASNSVSSTEFQIRRIREMLIYSAIMSAAFFTAFVVQVSMAILRTQLLLKQIWRPLLNGTHFLLELSASVTLLLMLVSLLYGNRLSELCCRGRHKNTSEVPLLEDEHLQSESKVPAMYDV